MTCNQLIKENKRIIIKFDNFIKTKLKNPDETDNYEYVNAFCHNLYIQINETIIRLDLKKCTIIENDILQEQLKEMVGLYFSELNGAKEYTYWQGLEELSQDYFDNQNSFIEPNKFTKEYLEALVSKFSITHNKKGIVKKGNMQKAWFRVGVKFATGDAYKYKGVLDVIKATEKLTERRSDREWFSSSWYGTNEKRPTYNIFTRDTTEQELNEVVEYCINILKKEISPLFLEDIKKYKIELH